MWPVRWILDAMKQMRREATIPAPRFRACKRTARIMHGLWYGRLTPEQARKHGGEWGFPSDAIEDMISQATQPSSYWSKQV
jgi:hypothetical protein